MKFDLKGKKNIVIVAACAVVVFILVGRFVFVELVSRSNQLGREIKVAEANLAKIIELQKRKDAIASDIKKYQPYLLGNKLDDQDKIEVLLKEVERVARETGVSVLNLSPQEKPEAGAEATKHKADLRLEARSDQIYNLINKIQADSLLILIDKITISPKDDEASTLKADATISLVTP
ncbi:MAG: hypothetical protein WCY12_04220 [Candidatus Omnitrophota bacterium]|jgi:hypothetical protein